MSSALVRQALELVDPEENVGKRGKRRAAARASRVGGQETVHPYKHRNKKSQTQSKSSEQSVEDNIKKLLALSKPTANTDIADKIIERAIKGKPLLEKIEVKPNEHKSILFPEEESFKKFEKEYFCS